LRKIFKAGSPSFIIERGKKRMCKNCVLTEQDIAFLKEGEIVITASGARVELLDKRTDELKVEIADTTKKLLLLV
jgi:preprotein translocase subunit YajC